jgi:hypothetical protein
MRKQQELVVIQGTSSCLSHMMECNKVDKKGMPIPLSKTSIEHTFERGGDEFQEQDLPLFARQVAKFRRYLVRWMVYCHVAFFMVENVYFRELTEYMHKGLAAWIPAGADCVRGWVLEEFKIERLKRQSELDGALSNIHISFDLWTSPNHLAIVSIYSHFIDARGERKTRLLGFRRIQGEHTGVNQAKVVLEVFREYRIEQKIGYFVLDNASTNDATVERVLKTLYPKLTTITGWSLNELSRAEPLAQLAHVS